MAKWMQKANPVPGKLHRRLGIPEGKPIPTSRLLEEQRKLSKQAKGAKKLSADALEKLHEIQFALRARKK